MKIHLEGAEDTILPKEAEPENKAAVDASSDL